MSGCKERELEEKAEIEGRKKSKQEIKLHGRFGGTIIILE
jgi:hypothetical protein